MTWHEFRSPAKVNLHLQVVGRRPDGYHELRTVFQTIDLEDRLLLALGGQGIEIECDGAGLPAGGENLAARAAAAFAARFAPGLAVRIRLEKRIPVGGGLGGGSSDAATVLLALRALLGRPGSAADLWEAARELGADVPFFPPRRDRPRLRPRRRAGPAPRAAPVAALARDPAAGRRHGPDLPFAQGFDRGPADA
ncbi:MAG: hypothetical protein M5U13_06255 [Thermoanaerobaculia bacterium]|nr:hypothetical protein [Thermoanaerobaculia bacterium]